MNDSLWIPTGVPGLMFPRLQVNVVGPLGSLRAGVILWGWPGATFLTHLKGAKP